MIFTPDHTIALKSGEQIPLLFNTWAQREYCKRAGIELKDLLASVKTEDLPDVLLVANEAICKYNNMAFSATIMDACLWVDEMGGFNGAALQNVYILFLAKVSGRTEAELLKLAKEATEAEAKGEAKKKKTASS